MTCTIGFLPYVGENTTTVTAISNATFRTEDALLKLSWLCAFSQLKHTNLSIKKLLNCENAVVQLGWAAFSLSGWV